MGRPKLDSDYYKETYSWNIRLRKHVLEKFLDAFHKEKARRKGVENKGYFINRVISEMMLEYAREVEANEQSDTQSS